MADFFLALDLGVGLFGAGHSARITIVGPWSTSKTNTVCAKPLARLPMNSETRGAVFVFAIFILACAAILAADHLP